MGEPFQGIYSSPKRETVKCQGFFGPERIVFYQKKQDESFDTFTKKNCFKV